MKEDPSDSFLMISQVFLWGVRPRAVLPSWFALDTSLWVGGAIAFTAAVTTAAAATVAAAVA